MRVSPTTVSAAASGIRPEHLHHYAPGEIVAEGDSGADRRRRVFYRQFRYQPSVVSGPGINSLLMVIYRQGTVLMRRRCEAAWQEKVVQPGDISVLGAGMPSDWEWDQPIEVSHVYLSYDLLAETCAHAFDQDYRRLITARDALDIRDPKSVALADMLIGELCTPSAGGALLVDTLAQTLSICAIRDYHWNPGCFAGEPQSGLTRPEEPRAGVHRGSSRARFRPRRTCARRRRKRLSLHPLLQGELRRQPLSVRDEEAARPRRGACPNRTAVPGPHRAVVRVQRSVTYDARAEEGNGSNSGRDAEARILEGLAFWRECRRRQARCCTCSGAEDRNIIQSTRKMF